MIKFEKISKKQFNIDVKDNEIPCSYSQIILPRRATKASAGYDFFSLVSFSLAPGEQIKIPTGIRIILPEDRFLMIVPRSSLGFKYRLQLNNTAGIIDSDYAYSDNEGHIWIKITNDSKDGKKLHITTGDAIAQGIILPFFKADDDTTDTARNGGLGSTSK